MKLLVPKVGKSWIMRFNFTKKCLGVCCLPLPKNLAQGWPRRATTSRTDRVRIPLLGCLKMHKWSSIKHSDKHGIPITFKNDELMIWSFNFYTAEFFCYAIYVYVIWNRRSEGYCSTKTPKNFQLHLATLVFLISSLLDFHLYAMKVQNKQLPWCLPIFNVVRVH